MSRASREAKAAEMADAVLAVLQGAGRPLSIADVAAGTGFSPILTSSLLVRLLKAGSVQRHGDMRASYWSIRQT